MDRRRGLGSISLPVVGTTVLSAAMLLLAACGTTPPSDSAPAVHHPAEGWDEGDLPREPLSPYGNPESYEVAGQTYRVRTTSEGYVERGQASWYGTKFHGERTSSGETYDMHELTAAHKELPLPTFARVTHLENGRSVVVRINDRGPFVGDRLIDLSYGAARALDMDKEGVAPVEVEALTSPGVEMDRGQDKAGRQPPAEERPYFVRIAAFEDRTNAKRLAASLDEVGDQVRIVEGRSGDRTVHRVELGPYTGRQPPARVRHVLRDLNLHEYRFVVE